LPSPAKLTAKPKRNIFTELVEGIDALEKQREGKITVRTFNVESKPVPKASH
jgi:putative transcriptional regulator